MLTPDQVTQFKAVANPSPSAPKPVQDLSSDEAFNNWLKPSAESAPQPIKSTPIVGGLAGDTIKNTADTYAKAPKEFMDEAGRNDESTSKNPVIRAGENALGATASGINTVFAPITGAVKSVSEGISDNPDVQKITQHPVVGKLLDLFGKGSDKLEEWSQSHPEAARNLSNLLTVGLTAAGGETKVAEKPIGSIEGIKTGIKEGTEAIKTGAKESAEAIKNIPENAKGKVFDYVKSKQGPEIDKLEADYDKWTGQTKPGSKAIAKAESRTEALNKAGTTGKTPQRVLAEAGIIPETEGTKFKTVDQANDFRERVRPLNEALTTAVKDVDYVSQPHQIGDMESSAISRVNDLKMPMSDKKALISDIKEEFGLLKEKYGDTMSASDMQNEKPNYWGGTKFDSAKPFKSDAYYQVAKSMQQGIEDMATKGGFEDIAQLNREIGDRLEAAKFLERLNGQTLKYGKIGKYAFMGIGSTLGKTFTGKVLGALGGEAIGDMLMRADVANPVKRLILSHIEQTDPEAYTKTLQWIKKQGLERELRLALPKPSAMYVPPMQEGKPYTPNFGGFTHEQIVESKPSK